MTQNRARYPTSRKPTPAPPDVFAPVQSKPLKLPPLIDWIWVIGLMIFIYAGMPLVTFHADESQQMYMAHDFWTLFINQQPNSLLVTPPYNTDSDAQLRILNGSVNRYAIGFLWNQTIYPPSLLPGAPGWDWGRTYQDNIIKGRRPTPDLLDLARLPSTIFLMLSVPVIWALGYKGGGRLGAYVATFLYALNPAVLLNGAASALQEGAMLFFGLYTVYLAAVIAERRQKNTEVGIIWLWFFAMGGLAIASKHTGAIFVAGAVGWLFASDLVRAAGSRIIGVIVNWIILLPLTVAMIGAVFIALSPALWNDPPARLQDLLQVRSDLATLQTQLFPTTTLNTVDDRANAIFSQPFIAPLMHYEAPSWGTEPAVQQEIATYQASPLSGIGWADAGIIPTVLAMVGAVIALRGLFSRNLSVRGYSTGMLVWLAVTVAALLVNPLNWQRYYLPLIPVASLLAAVTLGTLFMRREQQDVLTNTPAVQ